MKEVKYFNYKEKRHLKHNCPKTAKISAISGTSDVNNIKDIDWRKV